MIVFFVFNNQTYILNFKSKFQDFKQKPNVFANMTRKKILFLSYTKILDNKPNSPPKYKTPLKFEKQTSCKYKSIQT